MKINKELNDKLKRLVKDYGKARPRTMKGQIKTAAEAALKLDTVLEIVEDLLDDTDDDVWDAIEENKREIGILEAQIDSMDDSGLEDIGAIISDIQNRLDIIQLSLSEESVKIEQNQEEHADLITKISNLKSLMNEGALALERNQEEHSTIANKQAQIEQEIAIAIDKLEQNQEEHAGIVNSQIAIEQSLIDIQIVNENNINEHKDIIAENILLQDRIRNLEDIVYLLANELATKLVDTAYTDIIAGKLSAPYVAPAPDPNLEMP